MANEKARQLRHDMTDAERFVWQRLRSREFVGYKFRRQMPIGPYIVNFVCLEKRLILELDGGQHVEQADYDRARTDWLVSQGFRVLRYWNHEVFQDWDAIEERCGRRCKLKALHKHTNFYPSPPTPLPQGARGAMVPPPAFRGDQRRIGRQEERFAGVRFGAARHSERSPRWQ